MKKRAFQRITHPIIGRVSNLIYYVVERRGRVKNVLRYNFVDGLLKQLDILFKYAMRQLNGKDYIKRAIELCEEIQAETYLIHSLRGFTEQEAATIDVEIDTILDELIRISKSSTSESSQAE